MDRAGVGVVKPGNQRNILIHTVSAPGTSHGNGRRREVLSWLSGGEKEIHLTTLHLDILFINLHLRFTNLVLHTGVHYDIKDRILNFRFYFCL